MAPAHAIARTRGLLIAIVTSILFVAFQLAARTLRDASFLAAIGPARLPGMTIAVSFASIVASIALAPLAARRGPARFLVGLLIGSALLFTLEWLVAPLAPSLVIVAFYLHVGALGPLLFSGFWAWVAEHLGRSVGRRAVARIALYSSLGAVVGLLLGVALRRAALGAGALLVLAAINLGCAALLRWAPGGEGPALEGPLSGRAQSAGATFRMLVARAHVRQLAALVLLTAAASQMLDFPFKAATDMIARHPTGPAVRPWWTVAGRLQDLLLGFNCAVFAAGFVLQQAIGRLGLDRSPAAWRVVALPAVVLVFGTLALVVPGYATLVLLRGAELVIVCSLFRSGYEHLFSSVSAIERRGAKVVVDAGFGRAGEALVGALVLAGHHTFDVRIAATHPAPFVLAAMVASAGAAVVAWRLDRSFRRELQSQMGSTSAIVVQDPSGSMLSQPIDLPPLPEREAPALTSRAHSMVVDLRSGDFRRIATVLDAGPLDPEVAVRAIPLLARDDVARHTIRALRPLAGSLVGPLTEYLLDTSQPVALRRRIPRVLLATSEPVAVEALLTALDDDLFEVRFHSALALQRMARAGAPIPRRRVYVAVQHELDRIRRDEGGSMEALLAPESDGTTRQPSASFHLDHVFTLLGMTLDPALVARARHALQSRDPHRRDSAVDWFERALPRAVRDRLLPALERVYGAAGEREPGVGAWKRRVSELLGVAPEDDQDL